MTRTGGGPGRTRTQRLTRLAAARLAERSAPPPPAATSQPTVVDFDAGLANAAPSSSNSASTSTSTATAAAAATGTQADRITALMAAGRLADAAALITAHARLAEERGTVELRLEAATWKTMRALVDGRVSDARFGTELVQAVGQEAHDPQADERYLTQRFWVVLLWGDEDECCDLLDQCRERAYCHGDLQWRARLALLCAALGRTEEAQREFDTTVVRAVAGNGQGRHVSLDLLTDLAETAFLLGDPARAAQLSSALAATANPMVVAGEGWVLKGATARYQALVSATLGHWHQADAGFAAALQSHRQLEALPLAARTLQEWARSLKDRDPARAAECEQQATQLAQRLQLAGPRA